MRRRLFFARPFNASSAQCHRRTLDSLRRSAGLLFGVAMAATVATPSAAHAANDTIACPSQHITRWTERAMKADCETCWAAASPAGVPGKASGAQSSSTFVDWIAPAGGEAAMALAALPEASERFAADLAAKASAVHGHMLLTRPAIEVSVHTGPGWKGYVAVEMTAHRIGQRKLPPDAQAFVALTEDIAAGTEGTAIERHVVRAVVGPLPLDELATKKGRVNHVHALNVPESAKPERLSSVAWVQTPDGAVIAVANSIPAGCPGAP